MKLGPAGSTPEGRARPLPVQTPPTMVATSPEWSIVGSFDTPPVAAHEPGHEHDT